MPEGTPRVFICHASADKEGVVDPLVHALAAAGVAVWYDRHHIRAGVPVVSAIHDGLRAAELGVVIASPAIEPGSFADAELHALLEGAVTGRLKLVPVRHGYTHAEVTRRWPLLSAFRSLDVADGMESLAAAIADGLGTMPDRSASAPRFPWVNDLHTHLDALIPGWRPEVDPDHAVIFWLPTPATGPRFTRVRHPNAPAHQVAHAGADVRLRFLPLLVIPRRNPQTGALEVLMKRHGDWGYVLPSSEQTGLEVDGLEGALGRAVGARLPRWLAPHLGGLGAPSCVGGLISLKVSPDPTKQGASCFLFPIVALRATIAPASDGSIGPPEKPHDFVSKETLRRLFDDPAHTANRDVYVALMTLFEPWERLGEWVE